MDYNKNGWQNTRAGISRYEASLQKATFAAL